MISIHDHIELKDSVKIVPNNYFNFINCTIDYSFLLLHNYYKDGNSVGKGHFDIAKQI